MQPIRTNRIGDSAEFARVFGVSRETLARLEIYARLLKTWQKTINLVAPSTLDDIWHRHFSDSAQVLGVADAALGGDRAGATGISPHPGPPAQGGRGSQVAGAGMRRGESIAPPSGPSGGDPAALVSWVDLGSGAGFPGLVVGILLAERGQTCLTLVDSDQRKAAFLREVVRETGLKAAITVDIVVSRIESGANHSRDRPTTVVSARALAPLPKLLGWAQPYFGPETVGVFLKGREAVSEVEAATGMAGWELALQSSVTDADARIVVARRV